MKPRILFLDHVGVLGGAELSLLDVARSLAGTSHVVLFDDGPFRERLEQAGVPVAVLSAPAAVRAAVRDGGSGQALRAIPGVFRLAARVARMARAFDLVYANSQKAFVVGSLAARLAGRPLLWHLRDLMSEEHFSASRRWLAVTLGNRLAARVVANSEATARAFVAAGGQAERVRVVYNGIDPAPFDAVDAGTVMRLRRQLGLGDRPVVGVFSRLAAWKGQHILLEALARLPGVQALLVGDALFAEDRTYAAQLREQAAGLGGRVHFLGFRDDVPALLHLVDVVVHTSVAPEPFGRVVVEGMMAGRPVVATRAGGVPELVEEGRTGRLVPPGDVGALVEVLEELFAAPEAARAMGERAASVARTRFSKENMLAAIERVIGELVP
ncbi:MAG: glycosyl transferase [Rhodothermaceae bacterium]|nr:MAG: glycosyl transferase [Rhodothermaceae bacterium]